MGIRYDKYYGMGWSGSDGEEPCDNLEAFTSSGCRPGLRIPSCLLYRPAGKKMPGELSLVGTLEMCNNSWKNLERDEVMFFKSRFYTVIKVQNKLPAEFICGEFMNFLSDGWPWIHMQKRRQKILLHVLKPTRARSLYRSPA